jgi:hypothetical protein
MEWGTLERTERNEGVLDLPGLSKASSLICAQQESAGLFLAQTNEAQNQQLAHD